MNIAVIIPYKNTEAWFDKCLMSCLKAFGDFSFLLINDGSTDASQDIAANFAALDDRFTMFNNEHAAGVSGARNTGLDNIKHAEWFTFLDADDVLNQDAYTIIMSAAHGTDADVIQFNHLRQYAEARPIMKHYNHKGWRPLTALPSCWIPVWNKAYRSKELRQVMFHEGVQFGEDELYNLDILKRSRGIQCEEGTTITRRFPNPKSLSKSVIPEDLRKEVERLVIFAGLMDVLHDRQMYDITVQRLEELKALPRYDGIFKKEA